eukprot:1917335-Alexandrium_andersonii.AAC.1
MRQSWKGCRKSPRAHGSHHQPDGKVLEALHEHGAHCPPDAFAPALAWTVLRTHSPHRQPNEEVTGGVRDHLHEHGSRHQLDEVAP